jgi:hypothetical protein
VGGVGRGFGGVFGGEFGLENVGDRDGASISIVGNL